MFPYRFLVWILISCQLSAFPSFAGGPGTYFVKGTGISIELSSEGKIIRIISGKNAAGKPVQAFKKIAWYRQQGTTVVKENKGASVIFTRTFSNDSSKLSCTVIEKFIPTTNSIRWELEVVGTNPPSGSEIITELVYPATTQTRFWTTWASPQYDAGATDQALKDQLIPVPGGSDMNDFIGARNNQWLDLLVAVPFSDVNYFFGLPQGQPVQDARRLCYTRGIRKKKQVSVTIKSGLKIGTCEVWYPEKSKGMALQTTIKGDQVILEVPLERGCAMVSIRH